MRIKGKNVILQASPSRVMNANADITHAFILDTQYLLNPMFCCDSGGIKGIPFSPMAQATPLDTFPEVIRISWLLPSASNEKGTPRETPDYKDVVEEKGASPALVGKQTVKWDGGAIGLAGWNIIPISILELLQAMMLSIGHLVLALTAVCRPYRMNEALCSGTSVCLFWFCHLTAVWPQTDCLTSLSLHFFMYKIGIKIVPPKKMTMKTSIHSLSQ